MNKNMLFTLVPLIALGFGLIFTTAATPGHGYISIPAVAFRPSTHGIPYYTSGTEIYNPLGDPTTYWASVQLPHGVTVTKVTFYFFDDSSEVTDYGIATLERYDHVGNIQGLAEMWTNDGGSSSSYDEVIDYPTIDNSQYSYYLVAYLNSGAVHAYSMVIEYTNHTSLPLILR